MWYFLFLLLVVVFVFWNTIRRHTRSVAVAMAILCLLVGLILAPLTVGMTTGALPEFRSGSFEGWLLSIDEEGLVFASNELEIDIGAGTWEEVIDSQTTGEDSKSLRRLSVPDPVISASAELMIGQRVRVHYRQWLIPNFRNAGTTYEVRRVESLP